ncbi:MAG: lipopolysaccharide heptosyltransferase I, partial [Candidatus Methylomirabilis sp.]|nr:lipopolysaccharide heptosyltransferase I [Deltaproteobacteria bacterium]
MKILLVRLSALGDIVSALPALGALRRGLPEAEIHWLVEDRGAALVRMVPGIARVHVYERRRLVDGLRRFSLPALLEFLRFVRAMRREGFDVAVDFQGNLKSGALARLSGARRRIGFPRERSREWSGPLLNERPAIDSALVH